MRLENPGEKQVLPHRRQTPADARKPRMMHPESSVLKAAGLVFSYGAPPAPPLFDGLSFVLPAGVTWLGGGEGSGKTTLLQLLAGALPASAVQGRLDLRGASLAQDPLAYGRQLAWLDPRGGALDLHTARDIFAAMAPRHAGWNPDALQAHIAGLSLAPHLDKALFMMSTGTRRKVLIAATLAAIAPLTLLDQPFMALDRPSISYLLDLLAGAAHQPAHGRAWVVADYEAPPGVPLANTVELTA